MKKLVIVEDDPDISRSLTIRLSKAGYEVHTCSDAVLAMSRIRSAAPDLVVLDISMPGGTGFEIVERMREVPEVASIPCVFITASKRPDFRERADELGAVGYFEKPYDAHALLDCVADAVGEYTASRG